jgi:hypothetical protein
MGQKLSLFVFTRGSALQISANHVFNKKFQKNIQKKFQKKISKNFKKKYPIFFLEIKKTGLPKLLRMS